MNRNLFNKVFTALSVLTVMLVLSANVQAQVKPFKVKGTGDAPFGLSTEGLPLPYSATGTATHFGKYTGTGCVQVIGNGLFIGAYTFVAANGDTLECEYCGTFALSPAGDRFRSVFDAIFIPVKGTGRFADVGGCFRMIATTEPFDFVPGGTTPFEFNWRGKGELEF